MTTPAHIKTNAIRIIEARKIAYKTYSYEAPTALSAVEVAATLGQNPAQVFKTLVTTGKSGTHYVFMLPAAAELNLKKAAAAVNEKSVEMLKQKDLLPLTGYIHGGCSPIGMKKQFQTVADSSAANFSTIIFSAGVIGMQVELSLSDLEKIIPLKTAAITA